VSIRAPRAAPGETRAVARSCPIMRQAAALLGMIHHEIGSCLALSSGMLFAVATRTLLQRGTSPQRQFPQSGTKTPQVAGGASRQVL
jgi:hypothetical protein